MGKQICPDVINNTLTDLHHDSGTNGGKNTKDKVFSNVVNDGSNGGINMENCNNKPLIITKESNTDYLEDDYIVGK